MIRLRKNDESEKITINVKMVKTHKSIFSNCCYIVNEPDLSTAFLIDPAWDLDAILHYLKKDHMKLSAIFLTHAHYDHINLVNDITSNYDIPVYMSKEEIEYYGYKCRNLHKVRHNEIIKVGRMDIRCILTMGHTKGSMCFLVGGNLFTGDTVFNEGCGVCNCHGGSVDDMYYSINYLKRNIGIDVKMFPGHTYGSQVGRIFGDIIKNNIYFQIEDRIQFANFRMRKGQKNLLNFK